MKPRVSFHTLGCKLNYSETSAIRRQIESAGYETVPFASASDLVVINTCSVTDRADVRCRALVRQIRRRSRQTRIVLTGCYAQLKPMDLWQLEGVSAVVGAADKFNVAAYVGATPRPSNKTLPVRPTGMPFVHAHAREDRTRAFLKVQDGCDYGCSFCTIPLARGASRSPSVAELVERAQRLIDQGSKEIVLTGINLGDFGTRIKGHKQETLWHLLDALERSVKHQKVRFRLSSIEPNLFNEALMDFLATSRCFVPHAHIPLQSGCDRILGLMRRRYTTAHYAACIDTLRKRLPDIAIGMDVLVGFPDERESDFETTYAFIKTLSPVYLHVFPYSERANTVASRMSEQIPQKVRAERAQQLRDLSDKLKKRYYERYIGQTREVLIEKNPNENALWGYTDNYMRTQIPYDKDSANTLCQVQLNRWNEAGYMEGCRMPQ